MCAGVEPQQVQSGTSLYVDAQDVQHLAGGDVELAEDWCSEHPG